MSAKPTHCYIGRKDCGCIRAARLDTRDKGTGRAVADMIADGLTVERMTNEEFDAVGGVSAVFAECPHEERQLNFFEELA